MVIKKIIFCSLVITVIWGYLYVQNETASSDTVLSKIFSSVGDSVPTFSEENVVGDLVSTWSPVASVADVVSRKTKAIETSFDKIMASKDQMVESIQAMKSAANTFQTSKQSMLDDFRDLPTNFLEANMFRSYPRSFSE